MSSVDTRIVDMQFNNAQFNAGVQSTLESLNNLKEGLNLGNIAENIEQVNKKLGILGVVGASAINKLVDYSMSAGASVVKNLIDPIIEGGKKRSLNLEQAYFQLRGLIDSEKEVAAVMDDVSYAVDGTAYGLDAAAVAAAQFAASGIRGGNEMRNALRGISGVAAMAGTSYENVANVFTKVAGQGRLMGDDLLRLSARGINAASVLGKAFGHTEAEIREMVTKGQVSFEMFSEAMNEAFGEHATKANETYTGSLMNLKAALARVGQSYFRGVDLDQSTGFFERQRKLFVALMPLINGVNEGIKKVFASYNKLAMDRRDSLVSWIESFGTKDEIAAKFEPIGEQIGKTLENFSKIIKSITGPIKEAFSDVFGDVEIPLLDTILKIVTAFQEFTNTLILNAQAQAVVKGVATGFFSTLAVGWNVLRVGWEILKAIASVLLTLGQAFWDALEPIRTGISNLIERFLAVDATNNRLVQSFVKLMEGGFDGFIDRVHDARDAVNDFIRTEIGPFLSRIGDRIAPLIDKIKGLDLSFGNLKSGVSNAIDKIRGVYEKLLPYLQIIGDKIKTVFTKIKDGLQALGIDGIIKLVAAGGLVALAKALWDMSSGLKGVLSNVAEFIDELKTSLFGLANETPTKKLFLVSASLVMLAGALLVLSDLDIGQIAVGLGSLTAALGMAIGGIWGLTQLMNKETLNIPKVLLLVGAMTGIAFAMVLMAGAIRLLAGMSWGDLAKGLGTIVVSIGLMTRSLHLLNEKGILSAAAAIGTLALGLIALSIAIFIFSRISFGTLFNGLLKIAMALGVMIGAVKILSHIENDVLRSAAAILVLAVAMGFLTGVLIVLTLIPFWIMINGIINLAMALGVMVLAMKSLSGIKGELIPAAFGILLLATALSVFAGAILLLSFVPIHKVIIGLGALMGALAGLAGALMYISIIGTSAKELIGASTAIAILAGSLLIVAAALMLVSIVPWSKLLKSVLALGSVMAAMVLALGALAKSESTGKHVSNALSMLVMAGVLYAIGLALVLVSSLSWNSILKGVFAMSGVLLALAGVMFMIEKTDYRKSLAAGAALIMGVAALYGLGLVLEKISSISWEGILKGLVGMGAALGMLVIALMVLGTVGVAPALAAAAALLVGAGSLYLVALALEKLAEIDWTGIEDSIGTMAAVLAVVAGGAFLATFGALGAGVLIVAAIGLKMLGEAMQQWQGISIPTDLPDALLMLAGAMMVFTPAIVGAVSALITGFALQQLAEGLMLFNNVSVSKTLPKELEVLADGIRKFGAFDVLNAIAGLVSGLALQQLAESVRAWEGLSISETIGDDLGLLAVGIGAFGVGSVLNAIGALVSGMALQRLGDSVRSWDGIEVNPAIEEQLTALANGISAFDDHLIGSIAALVTSGSLERLGDGVRSWEGVEVNPNIEEQLKGLARGIGAFDEHLLGAISAAIADNSIETFATGVKAWEGVSVNEAIEEQLQGLARGIGAFDWVFTGSWNASRAVEPVKDLAEAVKPWQNITVPSTIKEDLTNVAHGIKQFKGTAGIGADVAELAPSLQLLPGALAGYGEIVIPEDFEESLGRLRNGVQKLSGIDTGNFSGLTTDLRMLSTSLGAWSAVSLPMSMSIEVGLFATAIQRFNEVDISSVDTLTLLLLAKALGQLGLSVSIAGMQLSSGATVIAIGITQINTAIGTLGTGILVSAARVGVGMSILNSALGSLNLSSGASFGILAVQISASSAIITSTIVSLAARVTAGLIMLAAGVSSSSSRIIASFSAMRAGIAQQMSIMVATVTRMTAMLTVALMQIATGARRAAAAAAAAINAAISSIISGAISRLAAARGMMYSGGFAVGSAIGQGMASGIYSSGGSAISAAVSVAAAALAAAKSQLGVASPSKEFKAIGEFMVSGLVLGLMTNQSKAEDAAESLAESTVSSTLSVMDELQALLDSGIIEDPVITPVLDTSILEAQAAGLGRYLNVSQTSSMASSAGVGYATNRELREVNKALAESGERTEINFTQNNTSPKALSAAEIYRQTKNLVSVTKKGLGI